MSGPEDSLSQTVLWIRIGFNADPDPAFLSQCVSRSEHGPGSRISSQGGSGSRALMTYIVKMTAEKITLLKTTMQLTGYRYLSLGLKWRTSKLQEKPPALKKGHLALQNLKFLKIFCICGIFVLLDPDKHGHSFGHLSLSRPGVLCSVYSKLSLSRPRVRCPSYGKRILSGPGAFGPSCGKLILSRPGVLCRRCGELSLSRPGVLCRRCGQLSLSRPGVLCCRCGELSLSRPGSFVPAVVN